MVRELQVRDKYSVVVFDAEPLTIEAMQAGDVDALVVQDPYAMGYQSVRLLSAMARNDTATQQEMLPELGQPEGDIFDTGLKVVVPTDASPIKAEQFPGKVQHMTLTTFKKWLAKYNLSGS